MAEVIEHASHSLGEFLLLPGLTTKAHTPANTSTACDLVRFSAFDDPGRLRINAPFSSAIMQAVSGTDLAIALAKKGGISFIFHSQPIEAQARMIQRVKRYKAGFVTSGANLPPHSTMHEARALQESSGHSTIAITDNGEANGDFVALLGSNDFPPDNFEQNAPVTRYATGRDSLTWGHTRLDLKAAQALMWKAKQRVLPILDDDGRLDRLVFRRDYKEQMENQNQNIDENGRLIVAAGLNTRDYKERLPALIQAEADLFCIDSSDGYSEWVAETIQWIKQEYGNTVRIGAGNIVDERAFDYLAQAGADFIKVGVGPGSICITRTQKGIGRGQASALQAVAAARDAYLDKTGEYIPICADGGISTDYEMAIALALGADFLMLGRYFAGFDESPSNKVLLDGRYYKEYWAEGSNRANNWARYDVGGDAKGLSFEEGVDAYVAYAGSLSNGLDQSLSKLRSTMCNCGALSLEELRATARLVAVSNVSLQQAGHHGVRVRDGS